MKPNTIRIFRTPTTSGRDFKNINASDFDPKIHKKYVVGKPDEPEGELLASDAALAMADEYGVDISEVTGTGAGGRITKPDVQAYIDAHE